MTSPVTNRPGFGDIVEGIGEIGRERHADALVQHARDNLHRIAHTLRDVPPPTGDKAASAIVISAGPSVHRCESIQRIAASGYRGTVIAVDAAYVACLRRGVTPDYLVTLDPHPTRMVRWFGDKEWELHRKGDDYFERQDLNVEFRKNSIRQNEENIELVDRHGHATRAIVSSSAPRSVVERIAEARFPTYWWNPLVDDPRTPGSLTRALWEINRLPSMNTGGTVGTAAWVFASSILKVPRIGLVGMDLGYYTDTPLEMTQTYRELIAHVGTDEGIERYFEHFTFPLTGQGYYTDPTYFWYRRNFLQLLAKSTARTFNCTEGGTLFGDGVTCLGLDDFLRS